MQLTETKEPQPRIPRTEEVRNCPLCAGGAFQRLFAVRDRLYQLPGEFGLVNCAGCQLLILSPRPIAEQIGYYYPEAEYYSYQNEMTPNPALDSSGWLRWLRDGIRQSVLAAWGYPVKKPGFGFRLLQPALVKVFGKRALYSANDFPRYVPAGRALEIGCGNGVYLACLKQHGWRVAGVELSERAALLGKQRWGIEIHTGTLAADTFAPESFDYVRLCDVLEHVYDPVETLRLVARFLKPGGTVFLQTPNADSFSFQHWQSRWYGCETPRHLYLFSPATLRQIIEAAGLQLQRQRTLPVLPGGYTAEFSYDYEAAHPETQRAPRFQLQPAEYWPARKLLLRAYWNWLCQPLRGDVLQCWASKA
ncbi:MAG: class I SAM-dependent methyltransferase [Acidobacteria bacterium]|nr:class I SAM-dependent methyltransferase [Acidobacteriota bacterium]MBI3421415.1 class I SAM-dependent methyltransferase [Acidobacteriota bacterium]